jgi:L-serine dehydratase
MGPMRAAYLFARELGGQHERMLSGYEPVTTVRAEHAAGIAMEDNQGMTRDPIGGLVQIPCIERNAMGAAKAVHAPRIAMNETETNEVSLDQVIRTMYVTGLDMQSRNKETRRAGLALNGIKC